MIERYQNASLYIQRGHVNMQPKQSEKAGIRERQSINTITSLLRNRLRRAHFLSIIASKLNEALVKEYIFVVLFINVL